MKTQGMVVMVGLVVATVLIVGLIALVRRDQVVGQGGEIQWDDFGFTVVSTRTATELGPIEQRAHAHGLFRVIGLKVANHAKRVDYDMSKHAAVLFDAAGNRYDADPQVQAALKAESSQKLRVPARIAAGESCVTELAYDVPADARGLYLKISWGGVFVDTVDFVLFGDRRIEVATSEAR